MTPAPHPSCYTCNHFEDKQWGMCCNLNSDDYGLSQFMVSFIERVGCASHRSTKSEMVLDENGSESKIKAVISDYSYISSIAAGEGKTVKDLVDEVVTELRRERGETRDE
jgi:hypothetical protein